MRPLRLSCALALIALVSTSALAAQRTFVASNGNDANPCTRALPCRGFTAALALTDPNGEVIVVDSAGYGAATITQSVSIIAPPGVYAGITVFSGTGIVVNGSTIKVKLSGLTINGQGGLHGIQFQQGASLYISEMKITGLNGSGVSIEAPFESVVVSRSRIYDCQVSGVAVMAPGKASVQWVEFRRNGTGASVSTGAMLAIDDSGIMHSFLDGVIASADTGQSAQLTVSRSLLSGNGGAGVNATSFGGGAVVHAAVVGSTLTDNVTGAAAMATAGGSTTLTVQSSLITRNTDGVAATGATVVADGNTITRNTTGILISGGTVRSAGDNTVDTNGANLSGGSITAAVVM